MPEIYCPDSVYFLAHNGVDVFWPGTAIDQLVSTGQPNLETFPTLAALNARLAALGQPAFVESVA